MRVVDMKGFIEVTEHYQKTPYLIPLSMIALVYKRDDGVAHIMFVNELENASKNIFGRGRFDTLESYAEVIAKIKAATE